MSEISGRPTTHERMPHTNYADAPVGVTGNGTTAPTPPNTIRDMQITQLDHGYVVAVGCQRFAIESATQLIVKLQEYIFNPAVTEQKWNEGKLF